MKLLFKVISESVRQAFQQLSSNRLRSFLSLLGIAIGIFCIIGVLAAVDSLEDNVRGSLRKLGDDVIYVMKISWTSNPADSYFKYLRWPGVSYDDFEAIKEKIASAQLVGYYRALPNKTVKQRSSSVEGIALLPVTYDFSELFGLEFINGRYFSPSEDYYGANKAVLGYDVAEALFGRVDPIGKEIKAEGRKMEVIGVLEKSGDDLVSVANFDEVIIVPYNYGKKIANMRPRGVFEDAAIAVKAAPGVSNEELKGNLIGVLRAERRLGPREENNFSLNELSFLSRILNDFFSVLNQVGFFIGFLAIVVGGFNVANIMFVSVKERTRLIGIKKAIGAKSFVILLEFLIESIILCIIGGIFGLALVAVIITIIGQAIDFDLYLSLENILYGIIGSAFVGVLAGLLPASRAARLDPVVAMRK